jgi:transmembrane sensor
VADISESTAWRQRRLVFREESPANIAEQFNRYNRSPRIVVEGALARERRYGGTFDADDPESLIQFVARRGDLVIERSESRIVVRARR